MRTSLKKKRAARSIAILSYLILREAELSSGKNLGVDHVAVDQQSDKHSEIGAVSVDLGAAVAKNRQVNAPAPEERLVAAASERVAQRSAMPGAMVPR